MANRLGHTKFKESYGLYASRPEPLKQPRVPLRKKFKTRIPFTGGFFPAAGDACALAVIVLSGIGGYAYTQDKSFGIYVVGIIVCLVLCVIFYVVAKQWEEAGIEH